MGAPVPPLRVETNTDSSCWGIVCCPSGNANVNVQITSTRPADSKEDKPSLISKICCCAREKTDEIANMRKELDNQKAQLEKQARALAKQKGYTQYLHDNYGEVTARAAPRLANVNIDESSGSNQRLTLEEAREILRAHEELKAHEQAIWQLIAQSKLYYQARRSTQVENDVPPRRITSPDDSATIRRRTFGEIDEPDRSMRALTHDEPTRTTGTQGGGTRSVPRRPQAVEETPARSRASDGDKPSRRKKHEPDELEVASYPLYVEARMGGQNPLSGDGTGGINYVLQQEPVVTSQEIVDENGDMEPFNEGRLKATLQACPLEIRLKDPKRTEAVDEKIVDQIVQNVKTELAKCGQLATKDKIRQLVSKELKTRHIHVKRPAFLDQIGDQARLAEVKRNLKKGRDLPPEYYSDLMQAIRTEQADRRASIV